MSPATAISRIDRESPLTPIPIVWLLMGHKAGDNNQVLALAETLGWPFEIKRMVYRSTELITNLLLGPTLAGIRQSKSSPLSPPWPDLIITAGRRNEPVARWIKARSSGRTRLVHLGRPWANPSRYDLIVTTPQYAVPSEHNVLQNTLPLHRVSEQQLQQAGSAWQPRLRSLPRPFTAVLLGGNSGPFTFTPDRARQLAMAVNRLAQQSGGALLVSSSARTPGKALAAFRKRLTAPHHLHEWIPNDRANPYFGYLALADAFVVTGESVSMLTETCATGKPVYIYDLGDHPVPLPINLESDQGVRLERTPWWRFKEHYRWKPLSHRLATAFGPKRIRRDVKLIHQHLIRNGHAVWLGESFPEGKPTPLPEDMINTAARVHALFEAYRLR